MVLPNTKQFWNKNYILKELCTKIVANIFLRKGFEQNSFVWLQSSTETVMFN